MVGGVLGRSRVVVLRLWDLDATAQDAVTVQAPGNEVSRLKVSSSVGREGR